MGKQRVHQLKTWPVYFQAVVDGRKPFEIRRNDRNFKTDDILCLKEWDPETKRFTNREVLAKVTYITDFAQQPGYVVMGIALQRNRVMVGDE